MGPDPDQPTLADIDLTDPFHTRAHLLGCFEQIQGQRIYLVSDAGAVVMLETDAQGANLYLSGVGENKAGISLRVAGDIPLVRVTDGSGKVIWQAPKE